MESALRSLKQESFVGTVSVITGTGNHSKGSFAKVAPQIRAYLREKGFIFREGTMDDGRGGIFIVTLR
ncbi:hypothetical protein BC830DRAFT_1131674 [Chytriomyces sp. MP71]|nr:hypothetical protein BC830DRAFT_1131674 [Chytriomyces sp. MP71]